LHFLKVLSYLLDNRTHTNNGHSKQAIDSFESKVKMPCSLPTSSGRSSPTPMSFFAISTVRVARQ
jgi:hypothetical protein